MGDIVWLTAFLDTDETNAPNAERFWCAVTGSTLSARRGQRQEFATLLPPDGDPFLRSQAVVQSSPGGLHLDLHIKDVDALYAEYSARGVEFTRPLGDTAWHSREFVVKDCDGRLLAFGAETD